MPNILLSGSISSQSSWMEDTASENRQGYTESRSFCIGDVASRAWTGYTQQSRSWTALSLWSTLNRDFHVINNI